MMRFIKDLWPVILVIFGIMFACICAMLFDWNKAKSLEAVTNADFTINDGHSMEAIDHAIITDMDTGIQYIYFRGYGVSPYIDEDGNVSKVTE